MGMDGVSLAVDKVIDIAAEPLPEDTVTPVPETLVLRFQTGLDTGFPLVMRNGA